MKKLSILIVLLLLFSSVLFAQIAVNTDGSQPNSSSMLDVKSTTKGMLIPRMTASQRTSISSAANGLMVYQTDAPAGFYFYNGTKWVGLADLGSISRCLDFDGNAYPTFIIGTQEWMGENLRVTHYRNGDAIPNITDNAAWAIQTSGAYCWYFNDEYNYAKYGILYNWYTTIDSRNLCPTGWHVPSDAEWTTLTTYLGGEYVAAGKMKSVSPLCSSPNVDATNNSGFSGLPGGDRNDNGSCEGAGSVGGWWTTTETPSNTDFVITRCLYCDVSYVYNNPNNKMVGFSIRCVRD